MTNGGTRCAWVGDDPLMVAYHDEEWGVPVHDDRALFEMLTLEGAQAGLSWHTVLKRRESYRSAFAGWDITAIASFGDADVERLLADEGIIRNRAKVVATIANARATLAVQAEVGSLDALLWELAGGAPRSNHVTALSDLPAETEVSKAMSKALKRRGFGFVGPTICYAFMQACGMVNDHLQGCFRYFEVERLSDARPAAHRKA